MKKIALAMKRALAIRRKDRSYGSAYSWWLYHEI